MEHFLRLSIFKRGQLFYSMDTSPFAEEVWIFLEVSQVLAYQSTERLYFNVYGLFHHYKYKIKAG